MGVRIVARYKVINQAGKFQDPNAYTDVIQYCTNPDKTPSGLIGGRNLDTNYAAEQMETVADVFGKNSKTRVEHTVLSFSPNEEISLEGIVEIADSLADYYAEDYQVLYAVHENTDNPHVHMVMNRISHRDGHRYRGNKQEYYGVQTHLKKELRKHGLHLDY